MKGPSPCPVPHSYLIYKCFFLVRDFNMLLPFALYIFTGHKYILRKFSLFSLKRVKENTGGRINAF